MVISYRHGSEDEIILSKDLTVTQSIKDEMVL